MGRTIFLHGKPQAGSLWQAVLQEPSLHHQEVWPLLPHSVFLLLSAILYPSVLGKRRLPYFQF